MLMIPFWNSPSCLQRVADPVLPKEARQGNESCRSITISQSTKETHAVAYFIRAWSVSATCVSAISAAAADG